MDKVRVRKHVGIELENLAQTLNLKPVQLLHLILEDWLVKNRLNELNKES